MVKFRKWGIAILAGWGGIMVGFLITSTFVITKPPAYWATIVGCGAAFAILAFFIETGVIMFVTSFAGSYFLIRGISLYAGGFPNEMEIHKEFEAGAVTWSTFDKVFYAYMTGIVVLTIFSLYFQVKHDRESKMKL